MVVRGGRGEGGCVEWRVEEKREEIRERRGRRGGRVEEGERRRGGGRRGWGGGEGRVGKVQCAEPVKRICCSPSSGKLSARLLSVNGLIQP